ncbi:MAG: ABC transporter permease [Oscillospiraceae bacterium]|nr:ABC transporter permease [Oscillospiraceae bacterium]
MKFIDIIRTCLRNLTKRKLRTALTISGVLIGTSAVIVMLSLGTGMNIQITKMLEEWADLTLIHVYNWGRWDPDNDVVPPDLDDDMVKTFMDMKNVKSATPFYTNFYSGMQIAVYTADGWVLQWTPFIGVYMDELENFGFKLLEGRFKQEGDPPTTILIGPNTGSYLRSYIYEDEYAWSEWGYDEETDSWEIISMPIEDFFKEEFRIIPLTMDNRWEPDLSVIGSQTAPNMEYDEELKLVGILEASPNDWEAREGIFIDISYMAGLIKAYNELNPDNRYEEFDGIYHNVRVRVDDMNNVPAVEAEIKAMGFYTSSFNEMRENMTQQVRTTQMLLALVAAVSLFVATMNITNTMIMAIIERTKEIGIMKVLGCDIIKIRTMFLGEAALIGFLGGVAGIGFSYFLSFIINNFLGQFFMDLFNYGTIEEGTKVTISVIPVWLLFASLAGATVIGMAAGWYPAWRSTKISALSAIAHE